MIVLPINEEAACDRCRPHLSELYPEMRTYVEVFRDWCSYVEGQNDLQFAHYERLCKLFFGIIMGLKLFFVKLSFFRLY